MMGLDRFRELLEAYGAEPRRWPANERTMAEALAAETGDARALRARAAVVDGLLDRAPMAPPIVDAEVLIDRITERPQAQVVRLRPRPSAGTFWLKVASLAAAALIGFLLGVTQLGGFGDTSAPTSGLELADISPW